MVMMNDIKLIYLAGSLRGNKIKKAINMKRAKRWARYFWLQNVAVYSPHLNSGFIDHPKTDEFMLAANREILKRCDAVVVMQGWEKSIGTKLEIAYAKENGIQVIYIDPVLNECTIKFNDVK